MERIAIIEFIFGMIGLVAFVQLQHLIKKLKEKGILDLGKKE
jgi:hypothetical protein